MDLSIFINSLLIIHIVTLYTCINAENFVSLSKEQDDNNNTLREQIEPIDHQLDRKAEIARLTNLGMDEPELFYNLTHTNNYPRNCSKLRQKLRELYKPILNTSFRRIWFRGTLKYSKYFYRIKNLSSKVRFEDYFALKLFKVIGYDEMEYDTDISRRMKNAIYSVALTQLNDPNEKVNYTLFKGFTNLTTWYREQFNETRKELQWNDFTVVETTRESSDFMTKGKKLKDPFNIMTECVYEMYFPKPYLRVNLDEIISYNIFTEVILLSGTKFFINETIWTRVNETNEPLTIKMTHNDENVGLLDQQKIIMSKLKKLRETGTQFYVCE
ncbi:uncharacterized protein LOC122512113 [Leptopilina heterotoma]|uniref:uncharacterized protein LOC122512113 n=1 Tax=Leptopilina heterotoma TaxID=63436 RepID=UPI001CAA2FAA|nr:uncharacterized protein LOC122512113 [Leptopilina heterotoma]